MLALLCLLSACIAKIVDLRHEYRNLLEHDRFMHEAKKELSERLANTASQLHRAEDRIYTLEDAYHYVCREYGVRPELERQFLVMCDQRQKGKHRS